MSALEAEKEMAGRNKDSVGEERATKEIERLKKDSNNGKVTLICWRLRSFRWTHSTLTWIGNDYYLIYTKDILNVKDRKSVV